MAKDRTRVALLDSSVAVEIVRGYQPAVDWLQRKRPSNLALPGIVALELMDGARDRNELRRLLRFIDSFEVVWPDYYDCVRASRVFRDHCLSSGLSVSDVLIGETAVGLDAILYALDGDFALIEGLEVRRPWEGGACPLTPR